MSRAPGLRSVDPLPCRWMPHGVGSRWMGGVPLRLPNNCPSLYFSRTTQAAPLIEFAGGWCTFLQKLTLCVHQSLHVVNETSAHKPSEKGATRTPLRNTLCQYNNLFSSDTMWTWQECYIGVWNNHILIFHSRISREPPRTLTPVLMANFRGLHKLWY